MSITCVLVERAVFDFYGVGNALDTLDVLIRAGSALDHQNDNGATCLMYAASTGKHAVAVVEKLLAARRGARPAHPVHCFSRSSRSSASDPKKFYSAPEAGLPHTSAHAISCILTVHRLYAYINSNHIIFISGTNSAQCGRTTTVIKMARSLLKLSQTITDQ